MPKIKVLSATPAPIVNLLDFTLTFSISCDTDNITSSSFSATCNLAASPSTPVSPSNTTNRVGNPPGPSTAQLVFTTTALVNPNTYYTLTIRNPSTTETWIFDNNPTVAIGQTNSGGSFDQVVGPQVEKKRRSFGQRMLDFFRRLFG